MDTFAADICMKNKRIARLIIVLDNDITLSETFVTDLMIVLP